MDLPKRKENRLEKYDYSDCGAYFITICTENRRNLFWENVGASIARPHAVPLSQYGRIVEKAILQIPIRYPMVSVEHYVVMPNHLHLLLQINSDENGRPVVAPTISKIVQQMKGAVTKEIGESIWQKSFYDHIIRSKMDYDEIWNYIEKNPSQWSLDRFYR